MPIRLPLAALASLGLLAACEADPADTGEEIDNSAPTIDTSDSVSEQLENEADAVREQAEEQAENIEARAEATAARIEESAEKAAERLETELRRRNSRDRRPPAVQPAFSRVDVRPHRVVLDATWPIYDMASHALGHEARVNKNLSRE